MNYFLGIDGGGTKTRCVCINDNHKIVDIIEGGSSNPLKIGYKNSAECLIKLIEKSIKRRKLSFCLMGIAGCGRKENVQKLKKELIKKAKERKILLPCFEILSDIEIAHEGAYNGNEGAILIIGTGSILFYKNPNENKIIIGGYGKLIGDEGSGYSIGKKGLQIISKILDGRLKHSIIADIIKEQYTFKSRDELINYVYNDQIEIPQIAQCVIKAADKNDKHAISLLEEEANEIISHIRALKKILKRDFKLCLLGSLITNNNFYSSLIKKRIKEKFNNIKIVKPKFLPEVGAAILAKKIYTQIHKHYDN